MKRLLPFLAILTFSLPVKAEDKSYDVVIYGATPGGISAGIAASRQGASVVIIEPSKWIGGMVTGGLAHTDIGKAEVIGGIAREFYTRSAASAPDTKLWYAEPKANMVTFQAMLKEANVIAITGQRLDSISQNHNRITQIKTSDGSTFSGKMFIDATYEGDLMAKAGVSYTVGREDLDVYKETLAGFQPAPLRPRTAERMTKPGTAYTHGTPAKLSAYAADGKLLPGIFQEWPEKGTGDKRIQAYNFRVIVTNKAENRVPFPKPKHYDSLRYELLGRIIDTYPGMRFEKLVYLGALANDKYDLNASGLVMGTDHVGANYDYPEGDEAARKRIWQDHVDWVQGFLWFLANDKRVPEDLRQQTNEWGLAKDEFVDNENWPYALYIREARRLVAAHVMTQQDCQTSITKPDSIGMGSFILDSHAVQRLVDQEGNVIDEGNFDIAARPYQIPYRSIIPKKGECENLLIPVCMAASHVAYGSIRMEPQFMILGQAAGNAAVIAVRNSQALQDVSAPQLQAKLIEQKQILELPEAVTGTLSSKLAGIVLDDETAVYTGEWTASSFGSCVDGFSRHDQNDDKGTKTARFTFNVPQSGKYEVRFAYAASSNRASNVPVEIQHADGIQNVLVNEKITPKLDGHFASLGTFRFDSKTSATVTVSTKDTDSFVSVDAIQLLQMK